MCWRRASGFDMPPEAGRAIARQVALALSEAHKNGVAHGDVTTDNVLVGLERGSDGGEELVAKLTDFGNARPSIE